MLVLKSRILIRLAALTLASLVIANCGSTAVPTPITTRSGTANATAAGGTPGAGLIGLAAKGEQLFAQYKCSECHSVAGERIVGPPLNGLYGSTVSLSNGQTVVADDAYLKLALIQPDSQIVNGYPSGVMSGHIQQFESQIDAPDTLDALLAYLKSLK